MVTSQKKKDIPNQLRYDSKDTYDEKANKTLGLIALEGPKTIYDLHTQTRMPLSTSQRIIRDLVGDNELMETRREKHVSGTVKKFYGITATGLAQLLRFEFGPVTKNFQKILEMWWEDHGIIKRAEVMKAPVNDGLMQLFRILGSVTEIIDTFDEIGALPEIDGNRPNKEKDRGVSSDSSLIFAFWMAFLLPKKKANFKMLHRLYHSSPVISKIIDSYFGRLSVQYKNLRK
ncbi:MAG: hypothetical protein ACE5KG_00430 [Nitrososphaerales archaeon]